MKGKYLIPASMIVGLGIAVSGYFVKQGMTNHTDFNRYVSVKGLAEKTVKADQAVWQMNISFTAANPTAVYQGIEASQNTIQTFLIEQGFAAESITRQPISINDNSAYNQNSGSRYSGYTNIIVSCNDVDRVNTASQQMNTLAAKNISLSSSNISYSFTQLNDIKPIMLDEATSNAEAAAQAFAKNSHSQLAGIRNASQGQFTISDDNNSGMSSIMKNVRVVTSVEYFLKN